MAASEANRALAEAFQSMALLLAAQGSNRYRVRAYQRAADAVLTMEEDIRAVAARGELRHIAGIGKELAAKIEEFLSTGTIRTPDEWRRALPTEVTRWVRLPGLTMPVVRYLYFRLKIQTLDDLEGLVRSHLLRTLPGMALDEEALLAAIARQRAEEDPSLGPWSPSPTRRPYEAP